MNQPAFGLTLSIRLELLTTEDGGRAHPVRSGYRPICIMPGDVLIGMCELHLDEEIPPGGSGEGRLSFWAPVSRQVRSLVVVGSRFSLAEGKRTLRSPRFAVSNSGAAR